MIAQLKKYENKHLSELMPDEIRKIRSILAGKSKESPTEEKKSTSFMKRIFGKPEAASAEAGAATESGYLSEQEWEEVSPLAPSSESKKTKKPENPKEAEKYIKKHLSVASKMGELEKLAEVSSDKFLPFTFHNLADELRRGGCDVYTTGDQKEDLTIDDLTLRGNFPLNAMVLRAEFDSRSREGFETSQGSLFLPSIFVHENIDSSQYPFLKLELSSTEVSQWAHLRERSQGVNFGLETAKMCKKIASSDKQARELTAILLFIPTSLFLRPFTERVKEEIHRYCIKAGIPLNYLSDGHILFSEIPGEKDCVKCHVEYNSQGFGSWLNLAPEGEDNPRLKESLKMLNISPAIGFKIESDFILGVRSDGKTIMKDIIYKITLDRSEELL